MPIIDCSSQNRVYQDKYISCITSIYIICSRCSKWHNYKGYRYSVANTTKWILNFHVICSGNCGTNNNINRVSSQQRSTGWLVIPVINKVRTICRYKAHSTSFTNGVTHSNRKFRWDYDNRINQGRQLSTTF